MDTGTQRLLRSILDPRFDSFTKVLDLGCGYGPIGLTLRNVALNRLVHMVDRDALAVEYSLENAHHAQLTDVMVYGSLAYSDVIETNFDLIISNLPAKAGEPVITNILYGALAHLGNEGLVAIVVVTPLDSLVSSILSRSDIEITMKRAWPGHSVFHYRFLRNGHRESQAQQPLVNAGIFERNRMRVSLPALAFSMRTVYGIPEFDSLSYRTELVLALLQRRKGAPIKRSCTFGAGQGHVAVGLWKTFEPKVLELVDRDLLSLRITKINLIENGCLEGRIVTRHQVGMNLGESRDLDLVVVVLDDNEDLGVHTGLVADTMKHLSDNGTIVVASRISSIARLERKLRAEKTVRILDRQRKNGYEALALSRRN